MVKPKSTMEMETPGVKLVKITVEISLQEILGGTTRVTKTPQAGTTTIIKTLVGTRTTRTRAGAIRITKIQVAIRTTREILGTLTKTQDRTPEEIPTTKGIIGTILITKTILVGIPSKLLHAGITIALQAGETTDKNKTTSRAITLLGKTTRAEIPKTKTRAGMETTRVAILKIKIGVGMETIQTAMLRTNIPTRTKTTSQAQTRILVTRGTAGLETMETLGVHKPVQIQVETPGEIPQLLIAPNHQIHLNKTVEDVLILATLEVAMAGLAQMHPAKRMMSGEETREGETLGAVAVDRRLRRLMGGDCSMWMLH